jgi:hypothetical protein
MAGSPQRGDSARLARSFSEQLRHLRTARPKRAHVKTLSFIMEGGITLDRVFPPALVTIDPASSDYPEYKRIVAIDGWLSTGGPVIIDWFSNDGTFYSGHEITTTPGTNRVLFDGLSGRPEPVLIENGDTLGGEFLQPIISDEPVDTAIHLSCMVIIETVPV